LGSKGAKFYTAEKAKTSQKGGAVRRTGQTLRNDWEGSDKKHKSDKSQQLRPGKLRGSEGGGNRHTELGGRRRKKKGNAIKGVGGGGKGIAKNAVTASTEKKKKGDREKLATSFYKKKQAWGDKSSGKGRGKMVKKEATGGKPQNGGEGTRQKTKKRSKTPTKSSDTSKKTGAGRLTGGKGNRRGEKGGLMEADFAEHQGEKKTKSTGGAGERR